MGNNMNIASKFYLELIENNNFKKGSKVANFPTEAKVLGFFFPNKNWTP